MTLELNLKTRLVAIILILCYPFSALADLELDKEFSPPASAIYVTDEEIINKLNLSPDGDPIWCYNSTANSLLISSAEREKEKCQLRCQHDIARIRASYTFEIDQLQIQIDSLNKEHEQILQIKNNQISELTGVTMQTPNDNSLWWAAGGVAAGVLTTLAIIFAAK